MGDVEDWDNFTYGNNHIYATFQEFVYALDVSTGHSDR